MKTFVTLFFASAFIIACGDKRDAPNDEATIPQHDMRDRDPARPEGDNPVRDQMKGTTYDTTVTSDTVVWPQPAR